MFEKKKSKKEVKYMSLLVGLIVCILGLYKLITFLNQDIMQPDELIQLYTTYINEQKYEEMYTLLDDLSQEITSQEDFISKNKNIYEGIEARDITVHITEVIKQNNKQTLVKYDTYMETIAGEVSFSNQAIFIKNKDREYRMKWYSQLIFPHLNPTDKVRVQTLKADRGTIYDRNREMLAGKTGTAEIKQSKDDQEGTELGWFNVFTADPNSENPLLIVSMVEDVKHRGGAGYVIPKVKSLFKDRAFTTK